MPKVAKLKEKGAPPGWKYSAAVHADFEVYVDTQEKHSGSQCATIRSIVDKPQPFGNLSQGFCAEKYAGKRLKMSAWVKSNLKAGTGQLWLRVDGEWNPSVRPGSFDNMDDRPIKKNTDWSKYELIVDVPETSTHIAYGLMLIGKGQLWLDDMSFRVVNTNVALTGMYTKQLDDPSPKKPVNLNFEG